MPVCSSKALVCSTCPGMVEAIPDMVLEVEGIYMWVLHRSLCSFKKGFIYFLCI